MPETPVYDAALKRYPVSYESRMLESPLGRTHVLLSGPVSAPPLVLIHGAGMNALAWLKQVAEFSASYRIIAVDLPGQSGKSEVRRLPLAGIGTANWLSAVLNQLDISHARILGGSLGGWVALKFATAYPARVDKLVLLAPGGIVSVNWTPFLQYAPALLTKNTASTAEFIQKMAHNPVDREVLDFLAQMIALQPFRTAVVPLPLEDRELQHISAPVLIVLGAEDRIFPASKLFARARTVLPHAQIVTLEACGHLIPHDQPDALMRTVMPFLARSASVSEAS